jgi:hypothetical protein
VGQEIIWFANDDATAGRVTLKGARSGALTCGPQLYEAAGANGSRGNSAIREDKMDTITFTKIAPPGWLLAMWKEIDDKTFGKGFDCFAEDAVCNLGVADWHGREAIRENLRQFIDKGFTAHHDVVEFWDSPLLKVFHGKVAMKFDDPSIKPVRPTMTHFFYMDERAPSKVKRWIGSVGPTGF